MKIKTSKREFEVKELKYKDMAGMSELSKVEASKILLLKATDMTDEEYEDLSLKDGIAIQKAVNDANGITEDFQEPLKE